MNPSGSKFILLEFPILSADWASDVLVSGENFTVFLCLDVLVFKAVFFDVFDFLNKMLYLITV